MDLRVQAAFAHGDALMEMDSPDTNNPLANFSVATPTCSPRLFNCIRPTKPPRARGAKSASADLQLANYDAATNAYAQVLNTNVQADVSLRSQAQIGIGIALEKKAALATGDAQIALLKLARENYLDVFDSQIGNKLRGAKPRTPTGCRRPAWRPRGWS